jgi:hypothetical protein
MTVKSVLTLPIIVPVAILAWLAMGFAMLIYKITGRP